MKNLKTILIVLFIITTAFLVNAQTKKIDVKASTIKWLGKKVDGEHTGTVNFKDGALVFKGKKLAGGSFTVDMTSINCTDLTGEYQAKLNKHLKADDFFGSDKFPTAKLVFKTIGAKTTNVYAVKADLTIKGVTKPVTFDMTVTGNTATTAFKIDRTKYDIKYNSGNFFENLGDKAINDDFEVTVALKF